MPSCVVCHLLVVERIRLSFQYANLYFLTPPAIHFRQRDLRQRQLPDPTSNFEVVNFSRRKSCSQYNRFVLLFSFFFFSFFPRFAEQRKRTRKITRVADPVISLLWFSPCPSTVSGRMFASRGEERDKRWGARRRTGRSFEENSDARTVANEPMTTRSSFRVIG